MFMDVSLPEYFKTGPVNETFSFVIFVRDTSCPPEKLRQNQLGHVACMTSCYFARCSGGDTKSQSLDRVVLCKLRI